MAATQEINRRKFLKLAGAAIGTVLLAGCDSVARTIDFSGKVDIKPQTGGGVVTGTVGVGSAETPKPVATANPTATQEVGGPVKTLPKPAAWNHEPTINLVRTGSVPSFPKSVAEAAATFGVDGSTRNPSRWEKTAEGDGWHLSEAQVGNDTKDALNVNARGYLAEFYYDTLPGRNPYCAAIEGIDQNIPAQGGTFWNEKGKARAEKLQPEMAVPRWRVDGRVEPRPCEIISPS